MNIPVKYEEMNRFQIVDLLKGDNLIGLELGVAEGIFSGKMLKSKKFTKYFGIDRYSDHHDIKEYRRVIKDLAMQYPSYTLIRCDFDDALDIFPENFFDFIYVDGYAHTGENAGETIQSWYPKLKVGGLMAGDDYHDDWPLVKLIVEHVVEQLNVNLMVLEKVSKEKYCMYPSWAFIKEKSSSISISEDIKKFCKEQESMNVRKDLEKLKSWSVDTKGEQSDS